MRVLVSFVLAVGWLACLGWIAGCWSDWCSCVGRFDGLLCSGRPKLTMDIGCRGQYVPLGCVAWVCRLRCATGQPCGSWGSLGSRLLLWVLLPGSVIGLGFCHLDGPSFCESFDDQADFGESVDVVDGWFVTAVQQIERADAVKRDDLLLFTMRWCLC